MIRLQGHSLTLGERFTPESMSLNLAERNSTASMKIAADGPALAVGEWLMDNTEPGKGIIWRVKTIETDYGGETLTVTLEHIINTLKDKIMFGEVKPSDMGGDDERCYAQQAMQYILSKQSVWQYGGIEYDQAEEFNFNGDSLFDALETVSSALADCWWKYDLSVYPFKLYIKRQTTATVSEMRMSRNISSIRKTIDRSRMYTRFYPIGKNNLHITGDYVQENTEAWGVVCKTETNNALDTEGKLRSWANDRLHRHSTPAVTITISGIDMSEATGESLDHIRLGGMCRVPLPEYGTTITERVIKIAFRDKINEPENITVTLSNALEDIASIINNQQKSSGGGGRAGAKNDEEDHAWFIDTESHVGMIAEAIIGQGPSGVDWSRVASIIVDGYGIHDRVVLAEGDIVLLRSEIEITESHWRATFEDNMNSLRSEIEMSASHLRSLFEDEVNSLRGEFEVTASHMRTEFTDEVNSLRGELEVTASHLRTAFESEAGSIRSELEMTASNLRTTFTDETNSLRSELQITASNIRSTLTDEANSLRSEIQQTASQIRSTITDEANSLRGEISQTASELSTLYTKTGVNSLGVSETLYSKITQNAESITTKVGKGDIASTINQTAQSVLIQAAKIDLDGYVTVSELNAVDAKIGNLTSGVTTASLLKTTSLQAASFSFNGDAARWGTLSLGNLKSMTVMTHSIENKDFDHYHGITISENDGVITVEIGAAASAAGSDSFNMADTAFYQNAVSAAIASVKIHAADITEYQQAVYNSTTHNTTVYIEALATNGEKGRQTFHVSGADAYADGEAHAESQYTQVSVTPIKATSAIRIDDTAVTLYNAGTGTKYDRGTGLTAYPVVSSGGTIYYEANAQATYRNAGSGTKYDRGTGLTAYPVVASGGTIYYQANAAATYYNAGTNSYTARGDSVTAREVVDSGGTLYYTTSNGIKVSHYGSYTLYIRKQNASGYYYESAGNHNWYYENSSGTQYYNRANSTRLGSSGTYYKGNGGSFTAQGSSVSVTPIKATSAIRLGSSGTYYPGDGGAFTPQGSEVVVTPIKATSAIRLGSSGTYYPGDGGSFTPQGTTQDAYKKLASGGTIYYQANPAATYYTKS